MMRPLPSSRFCNTISPLYFQPAMMWSLPSSRFRNTISPLSFQLVMMQSLPCSQFHNTQTMNCFIFLMIVDFPHLLDEQVYKLWLMDFSFGFSIGLSLENDSSCPYNILNSNEHHENHIFFWFLGVIFFGWSVIFSLVFNISCLPMLVNFHYQLLSQVSGTLYLCILSSCLNRLVFPY